MVARTCQVGDEMGLRERIGVDLGQRCKIEDGLAAAVENGIQYLDVKIDVAPNAIETLTPERIKGIRDICEQNGIHIGVHTMSAVNVAEVAPHVRDGVDRYLQGHMDACKKLGGEWMVVHAGYHFTSDVKMRMEAGLERLKRLSDYAEKIDLTLLLENMNWEPDDAEVHYLAHNVEEALTFQAWLPVIQSRLPMALRPWLDEASAGAMYVALVVATAVPWMCAFWSANRPSNALAIWLVLLVQTVVFVNAFWHLFVAGVILNGLSPRDQQASGYYGYWYGYYGGSGGDPRRDER